MILVFAVVASLVAGFGLGRVKNVAKLAAVKTEVEAAEKSVVAEVKAVAAKIKAKL